MKKISFLILIFISSYLINSSESEPDKFYIDIIQKRLKQGIDINESHDSDYSIFNGPPILSWCALLTYANLTRFLIVNKADVNLKGYGTPPLMRACSYGNPEIVCILIHAKADINYRPEQGTDSALGRVITDLSRGYINYNLEFVQFLINNKADINSSYTHHTHQGVPILFEAVRQENISLIKLLFENNANFNIKMNEMDIFKFCNEYNMYPVSNTAYNFICDLYHEQSKKNYNNKLRKIILSISESIPIVLIDIIYKYSELNIEEYQEMKKEMISTKKKIDVTIYEIPTNIQSIKKPTKQCCEIQ